MGDDYSNGPNDEEDIMEYPVLKMRVLNQTPSNLFEAFVEEQPS